jgi:hypothetical protein
VEPVVDTLLESIQVAPSRREYRDLGVMWQVFGAITVLRTCTLTCKEESGGNAVATVPSGFRRELPYHLIKGFARRRHLC